jgi:hypothetical protein
MSSQHGFQANTTINAAFWKYIPDPTDPTGRIILVEINNIQFIESTPDTLKVWLYYAANNTSSSQEPYILSGDAAKNFMLDLGALF